MRITPTEMQELANGKTVTEVLSLVGGAHWCAVIKPGANETSLALEHGDLQIRLSNDDLQQLLEPEREGVYFQAPNQPVRYYIEKDFPCAHPRAGEAMEPETETFQAPLGFEERKNS